MHENQRSPGPPVVEARCYGAHMTAKKRAPGVHALSTLTTLRSLKKDALGFLTGLREKHGDVARFQVGPYVTYLLSRPEHIKRVLVDEAPRYTKQTRDYDMLRLSLGTGMLTSEGEFWRRQRRIAQPAFHRQQIGGFAATMGRLSREMLSRWGDAGSSIDVAHEMMRVTLQIVSATLFSVELDSLIDEIGSAVATLNRQTIERIMTLVELPVWVPTARNRELHAATGFFDRLIAKQVADRRARGPSDAQQDDLLGMLLSARDPETGEGMSDTQLRDEAVTMLAAGHETTANALAWCLHLLAQHPEIERRLGEEAANVLGDRAATLEDLPRLGYAKQVFQESMRLYPPVWAIGRGCQEDDEIGGYTIERGADVTMSPWVTQRHPDVWPDPLRFDPDRFAEGRDIPKFAYFPFSGGARQCIGTGFAMMEGQIILATVLARYRLAATGRPVDHEALITLRPRGGLPMLLRRVA